MMIAVLALLRTPGLAVVRRPVAAPVNAPLPHFYNSYLQRGMHMGYAYYADHSDPSKFNVRDTSRNEWRGVITRTQGGQWESEDGKLFDSQDAAAEHNAPGKPPLKLGITQHSWLEENSR